MRQHEVPKIAEEMCLDEEQVIALRLRSLKTQHNEIIEGIACWEDLFEEQQGNELSQTLCLRHIDELRKELDKIASEQVRLLDRRSPMARGDLTEDQIEAARNAPITNVVDFYRGTATCFAHDDGNPSAYNGTRSNRLICPVCVRSWDAIGVLMERDGMNFVSAVKALT